MAQGIHSCGKAGSRASQLHTQAGPLNGSGRGRPSPGPEWEFCRPDDSQMRLAPQALSHSLRRPKQDGRLGRRGGLTHLCNFPRSSKAKGLLWPGPLAPDTSASHSTRGPFTAGPAGGAEGASLCKLLAPQLPVTPVARLGAGRVSAASGARQEGPWAMSPVPQITVCFYFQSPNHFFFVVFLFS